MRPGFRYTHLYSLPEREKNLIYVLDFMIHTLLKAAGYRLHCIICIYVSASEAGEFLSREKEMSEKKQHKPNFLSPGENSSFILRSSTWATEVKTVTGLMW